MKHWTQDVVPGAGVALVAAGMVLAFVALWPGVACVALGVALLLGLRALEFGAALRDAHDVRARVEALETLQTERDRALAKAGKDAEAALAAAVRLSTAPKQKETY